MSNQGRFLILLILILSLAACDGEAGLYAPDPYLDQANAQATTNAARARQIATQAAVEIAAQNATMQAAQTAGASEAEIRRLGMEITATAAAWQVGAMRAEATAAAHLTATAAPMTATAQAAIMNEVARADREKELRASWQERVIPIQAIFPTLFGAMLFILLFIGTIYIALKVIPILQLRASVYQRGPDHDAPLLVISGNGKTTVIDPDRSAGPALIVDRDGIVAGAVTPESQAGVTARDQLIDLARAGRRSETNELPAFLNHQEGPDIEIIDGQAIEIRPLLQEVENKLLLGG